MASKPIPRPWSMQMELTWGCDRRCWFCGIIPVVPVGHYHFMELGLVEQAVEELQVWLPKFRMEFGTGGEPTLNPQFFPIVSTLRRIPRIQIMTQSNGENWSGQALDWVANYFKAGGNILVINCYKAGLKEFYMDALRGQPERVVDFYYGNPDHLSMYHYINPKTRLIFVCDDLGKMTETKQTGKHPQRWINNQGGSTPEAAYRKIGMEYLREPLHRKCTMPFRQLVLNWDGRVPLCCYDWEDRLITGTFPAQSLQSIWEGRPLQLARQLLYRGDRQLAPCSTCDFHGGFRFGFLTDPDLGLPEDAARAELSGYSAEPTRWMPLNLKREANE